MRQKRKKHKKLKLSTILIFGLVFVVAFSGIYFFFTMQDENSKLTFLERQWIEKNQDTLIDIRIPNNIGILGSNGKGFVFDFLDTLQKDTKLNLNKVSYEYPLKDSLNEFGIFMLKNDEDRKETDIVLFEDEYVLIGKQDKEITSFSSLKTSKIGLLSSDVSMMGNYFSDYDFSYKSYDTLKDLKSGIDSNQVNYVLVPHYASLDLFTDFFVVRHLDDLSSKIVLRFGDNERLNEIAGKYANSWKEEYAKVAFEKSFMNYYISVSKMSDLDQASLKRKVYRYGYVKDTGYNVSIKNSLYGLGATYIHTLETMADMEFEMVPYSSSSALKQAFLNNEIDIAFVDFDDDFSTLKTTSALNTNFVVLALKSRNISSLISLTNEKIYIDMNSSLKTFLENQISASFVSLEQLSSIGKDDFIVLDELSYTANKNKEYSDYIVLLKNEYNSGYHYAVKDDEVVLYDFIEFVLKNTSKSSYQNESLIELDSMFNHKQSFKAIYLTIVITVLILFGGAFFVFLLSRKKTLSSKKEDVLKYNDLLTSLKNRNYLNAHINEWDETKIFPRTVIIADLNNLKYVNDNYGHEEGNELIKKAAAILINTQLEKSEIIRTDGNEFLIYLIGYSKTQVSTYVSKLSKEFEKLPHGFGAAIGYSMIEDEISTIDDAINEATIQMRMDKERNFR